MAIRSALAVLFATSAAALTLAAPAAATPPEGQVVRTDLAKYDVPFALPGTPPGPSTVIVQQLLLKPPSSSGWHTHEGFEVSLVARGTVVLQTTTNCAGTTYGVGQAVVIPGGVPHRVANTSTQDAEAIVTYTLPAGVPARGDAPNACAG